MKYRAIAWIATATVAAIVIIYGALRLFEWKSYAKADEAKTQLRFFVGALDEYRKIKGSFPNQKEGLEILVKEQFLRENAMKDPWKQNYIYICKVPDCSVILIYSKGSNGVDQNGVGDDIAIQRDARQ